MKFKWEEVFAPLRGEPSQSRLTPCQLPRKGELSTGERQLQKLSLSGELARSA